MQVEDCCYPASNAHMLCALTQPCAKKQRNLLDKNHDKIILMKHTSSFNICKLSFEATSMIWTWPAAKPTATKTELSEAVYLLI